MQQNFFAIWVTNVVLGTLDFCLMLNETTFLHYNQHEFQLWKDRNCLEQKNLKTSKVKSRSQTVYLMVLQGRKKDWNSGGHIVMCWLDIICPPKVKMIFSSRCFFQKTNERILLSYYETSGQLVFVCFLEEIEDTKKTFRNYLTFTIMRKINSYPTLSVSNIWLAKYIADS